jgi:lysophospholipase L1-like esterase
MTIQHFPSRSLFFAGIGFLLLAGNSLSSEIDSRKLLAVCGDSITAARLYSAYIENYFLMCTPQRDTDVAQFGWGGETAPGFEKRQRSSCLIFKPDAATICYGMNDGGYSPSEPKKIEEYTNALARIVSQFKEAGTRKIVVGSPGVVDIDFCKRIDPLMYNQTLADLAAGARRVATEQGVEFADIHTAMREAMRRAKTKYGKGYALGVIKSG